MNTDGTAMQTLTDQDSARELGLREYGLIPAYAGERPVLKDAGARGALDNLVRLAAS